MIAAVVFWTRPPTSTDRRLPSQSFVCIFASLFTLAREVCMASTHMTVVPDFPPELSGR